MTTSQSAMKSTDPIKHGRFARLTKTNKQQTIASFPVEKEMLFFKKKKKTTDNNNVVSSSIQPLSFGNKFKRQKCQNYTA